MNEAGNEGRFCASAQIPATAREFERWYREHCPACPGVVQAYAIRALLAIKSLDQPNASKSEAFLAAAKKDLADFAAAYAEWRG